MIDAAKRRLMDLLGWDEPQAYRAMRRASMDSKRPLAQLAGDLLHAPDPGRLLGEVR